MNRGVEIDSDVADGPHSVILHQVTNGVAIRMAVLYLLAGGKPELAEAAKGGTGRGRGEGKPPFFAAGPLAVPRRAPQKAGVSSLRGGKTFRFAGAPPRAGEGEGSRV